MSFTKYKNIASADVYFKKYIVLNVYAEYKDAQHHFQQDINNFKDSDIYSEKYKHFGIMGVSDEE